MNRRLFAVAFRALQESTKTAHFSVELFEGRSENDATRLGLDGFKRTLTAEEGWSHWEVLVKQIDPSWLEIAKRESEWFDQTAARRVYAIGVYAVNVAQGTGAILVGATLTYNEGCARDKLREFTQKNCPEAQGWTVTADDLVEWEDYPRRRPGFSPEWVPRGTTTH